MNLLDPHACDALDLRSVWRAQYPSTGPAWEALLDMGVDVTQLLYNLSLTPEQRLVQLDELTGLFEQVHGAAFATKP